MIGLLYPIYILYAIPAIIILLILIKMDFLRAKDDDFRRFDRRKTKKVILVTRTIIIICLFAALAGPYTQLEVQDQGPPKLRMLVDRTASMELLEYDVEQIQEYLEQHIPVTVSYIGRNTTSNLGDGIMSNLEQESNILLITDGYSNAGLGLGDAMLEASGINATISVLELEPKEDEESIIIAGDAKSFADVEYEFDVMIYRTTSEETKVKVTLDDEILFDDITRESMLEFKESLSPGVHLIKASIDIDDHFDQNNIYYKTVNVIDKPKVLLVTEKRDPIEELLDKLYDLEVTNTLPVDLEPYYAVILNDLSAGKINQDTPLLASYLMEGNGLMAIGGFNSYDRGSYKNSLFESILPVRVGSAEKKKGDANIVVVIDISGASSITFDGKKISPLDITKALALEVVSTLNRGNKVGVVAFNDKAYKVVDIAPLSQNKAEIDDKVRRLRGGGQSYFYEGLKGGFELLKSQKGDRNVILLTDGLAFIDVQDRTRSVVDSLYALGINTYTIGVGRDVQDAFLLDLARRGGGIYFPASESNKLAILFGEPEEIQDGDSFPLFVLNPNHFITQDYYPAVLMSGYNEVVPKSAARSLVTTSEGTPALTVWNYGVGRVASTNVFTGSNLGQLLTENNSLLISRTVNWLIADPERKAEYFVDVPDGLVNQPFQMKVKTTKRPSAAGFEFHKVDKGMYESQKFYVDKAGYMRILNTTFAANTEKEYRFIGFNYEIEPLVESTGGKLFKDIEDIPEFVTNASKVREIRKVDVTWPFILIAAIAFILEIYIRKKQEKVK